MSPITAAAITTLKRQYPHVDTVPDFAAQQSLKLLWDRVFSLQEQLTAAQATITRLVEGHNTNEADIETTATRAREALATSQSAQAMALAEDEAAGAGEDLPGGGDDGQGQAGCNAGLPTGHDSGGLLDAIRAGQITCGTGNEFSALRNPTPDLATREANAEELLRRVVWHLKQAGFSAGRQKNPSGLTSKDKITVVVDSILRAYDIYIDLSGFTQPLKMHMGEVSPPKMVDDAGIPD